MASSSNLSDPSRQLGKKLSILYRFEGETPFNEVVGLLQRVERDPEGENILHVLKRDGTLVAVRESSIIRLKWVPPARGPVRRPKSWDALEAPEATKDPDAE